MYADHRNAAPGPDPDRLGSLDEVAHALAGRTRRQILIALIRQRRYVTELADWLCTELSQVSSDLGVLHAIGAVVYDPHGHRRTYRPGPALRCRFYRGALIVHCRASCGSIIAMNMSPEFLADAERGTGSTNGAVVTIPNGAAHARKGGARKGSRRPSERGSK